LKNLITRTIKYYRNGRSLKNCEVLTRLLKKGHKITRPLTMGLTLTRAIPKGRSGGNNKVCLKAISAYSFSSF